MTRVVRLTLLLVLLAACGGDGAGPLFGDGGGTSTTAGADGDGLTTTTAAAAGTPLPIKEGLGTFDHYVWHMAVTTTGPGIGESTSTEVEWTFNREPESRISRITNRATGPDIEGTEETTTELYEVGGETCQWDGESWTHDLATDQEQEVLDAFQRLYDVVIVPENPIVLGSDLIAGLASTHYSFPVSGFGAESGALVTANQVDYWLDETTGAVLKYLMVLESQSGPAGDPATTVYRLEASAELVSANLPVPVVLSADCLALPIEG